MSNVRRINLASKSLLGRTFTQLILSRERQEDSGTLRWVNETSRKKLLERGSRSPDYKEVFLFRETFSRKRRIECFLHNWYYLPFMTQRDSPSYYSDLATEWRRKRLIWEPESQTVKETVQSLCTKFPGEQQLLLFLRVMRHTHVFTHWPFLLWILDFSCLTSNKLTMKSNRFVLSKFVFRRK